MTRVVARTVAEPVVVRAPTGVRGVVLGSGRYAAYIDLDGFVVALTAPGVPRMPNGVSVTAMPPPAVVGRGRQAAVTESGIRVGAMLIDWGSARRWVPAVPSNSGWGPRAVESRARAMLRFARAPQFDDGTSAAVGMLDAGLRRGAPELAREAVDVLLGRGSGLTPEGDDLLAGVASALNAFGAPLGRSDAELSRWLPILCPSDARTRTTSLSATLLELACEGRVAEPLSAVLDLSVASQRLGPALSALCGVGHSTGRAWMTGCAICAAALASAAVVGSGRSN